MKALWEGMLAGYAIAIPVGAIAILIVNTALRRGFAHGFMAGLGAASADLLYATLAAVAGGMIGPLLQPYEKPLGVISGVVLVALGGYGLWGLYQRRKETPSEQQDAAATSGLPGTYFRFIGLTILNPLTIVYFGALILGKQSDVLATSGGRLLFVAGAAAASASWQSLLAVVGALARQHLSPRFQMITSIAGNLMVAGLGVRALLGG